ncbi:MAG: OmpW family outer membrane protein [Candidatus Babeliales bacterium]|nr:OmpW family outer membrane protein [Candidatus Babeliales bacterium]
MILLKTFRSLLVSLLLVFPLAGRDLILEFKAAYFLPTDSDFKHIFHKGGALYGPELTVQLCSDENWYAFASFDYFQKKGNSVGLCDETSVKLIPLAFGLKYFMPAADSFDFYAGLGFQAMNARTKNCSDFVESKLSQWGFGGIAKAGAYYYLSHNFLIDIFVDYSFVKVGKNDCDCTSVQSVKANVSGAIFGAALGYKF